MSKVYITPIRAKTSNFEVAESLLSSYCKAQFANNKDSRLFTVIQT